MACDQVGRWRKRLEAAFSSEGVVGARYFGPVLRGEKAYASWFVSRYQGHDTLENAFTDFFAETLSLSAGEPVDKSTLWHRYVLTHFVAMLKFFRSSSLTARGGYGFCAYALQRTIKDLVIGLGAVSNGHVSIRTLRGFEVAYDPPPNLQIMNK